MKSILSLATVSLAMYCAAAAPVFDQESYSFVFVGGKRLVGNVVGTVSATDPTGSEVYFETRDKYAESYEMVDGGGRIKNIQRHAKKGYVYILPVHACSDNGCTITNVELVSTDRKGCLKDGTCPGAP